MKKYLLAIVATLISASSCLALEVAGAASQSASTVQAQGVNGSVSAFGGFGLSQTSLSSAHGSTGNGTATTPSGTNAVATTTTTQVGTTTATNGSVALGGAVAGGVQGFSLQNGSAAQAGAFSFSF